MLKLKEWESSLHTQSIGEDSTALRNNDEESFSDSISGAFGLKEKLSVGISC